MKIDAADRYFSLYIRTRDDWTCQRCGKRYEPPTSALHCSHFMGRGKENTRYMEENCDSLCYGCHRYFTSHPSEHYDWQVGRKGQDTVDKIRLAGSLYKKRDRKLEAIYWKKKLVELQADNATLSKLL